jgi:O-antigen ligase
MVASAAMSTAVERRANRPDVSTRSALLAPLPLLGGGLAALIGASVLVSDGSSNGPLVWIGGAAIACAAAALVAASVGALAVPDLSPLGTAAVGCVAGLVVWQGLSVLWSIEADRSWDYFNRGVVYLAFLVLGLFVGGLRRAPRYAAGWLAAVTAAAIVVALSTKIFPGLSAQTERVARLSSPIGYWNVLALLAVTALPLALWLAAPRERSDWLRAGGVVYLYAALVALLLTFSRGGLAVGIAAVALWIAIGRPRLESAAALAIALVPVLAVAGWAFSRPGLTKDAQAHSVQVHDGRWFGLALVLGALAAFALAFIASRHERRRPLSEHWRLRLGRAAVAAVAVAVLVGIGGLLSAGITPSRVLHKFNEPVAAAVATTGPGHLGSVASSDRWNWWREEWKAWLAHPVAGTGAGSFDLTHRRLRSNTSLATEPHNLPLQFLGEAGIVGFVVFLGIALAGASALVETLRRLEGEDRLAAAALTVGLFAYVVHGVVDFDWDFIAVTAPAMAVLGVLLAAGRPAQVRLLAQRSVGVVTVGAIAAAALYSLFSPWLATRQVDEAYGAIGRDNGAAVSHARSAHDLNPISVDAVLAWAAAETASGNVAEAGRLYTKAISIQPDSWRPWYYRAQLLAQDAGSKAALFDARQAALRDPHGPAGSFYAQLAATSK